MSDNLVRGNAFGLSNGFYNAVERPQTERGVVWNGLPVRTRFQCLQDHVVAFLFQTLLTKVPA